MSLSRKRISSPLEAGRSIMDAYQLSPQLTGALEYASKRLSRKALHITLVVVKNECQLPGAVASATTPASPPHTPDYAVSGMASPSRFTSSAAGFRQLVRRGTGSSLASSASASSSFSSSSELTPNTPNFPPPTPSTAETILSPRRWILPLTPGSPIPSTPRTPHTPSSIATLGTATTATSSSCAASHAFQTSSSGSFGVRLIYASPLSPRHDRILRTTIAKAERKFQIGSGGLPPVTTATACGLSADLIQRSIQQNEVLFSSDGLTLLGLDRLYNFKAALAAYARSITTTTTQQSSTPVGSPGLSNHPVNNSIPSAPPTPSVPIIADTSRLEDAVDSLRRLVLSNGGRPIPKGDLFRSFDSMGVNPTALADVEKMYRRAYGGPERRGPFEIPIILAAAEEAEEEEEAAANNNDEACCLEIDSRRMGFIKIGTPPPPKTQTTPVLKLNTNIATSSRLVRPKPIPIVAPVVVDAESTKTVPLESAGDKTEGTADTNELEIRFDGLEIAMAPEDAEAEDGDVTAHPARLPDGPLRPSMVMRWRPQLGNTIDTLLSPLEPRGSRQSQQLGPTTPNGYDDISPITRGEWGFLFKGETWTPGRQVTVETC